MEKLVSAFVPHSDLRVMTLSVPTPALHLWPYAVSAERAAPAFLQAIVAVGTGKRRVQMGFSSEDFNSMPLVYSHPETFSWLKLQCHSIITECTRDCFWWFCNSDGVNIAFFVAQHKCLIKSLVIKCLIILSKLL